MTAERLQNRPVASQGLAADDYAKVAQLASLCNDYDHITLKINDFMLQTRPSDEKSDFLYFVGEELIGYLGLFQFNGQEIEISGMVHPVHRRTGVFTGLLSEAKAEIARRNIRKLIFINAENSACGKLFLESIDTKYSFSEYWMKHVETKNPACDSRIQPRTATASELPFIARAITLGFQMDESEVLESISNNTTGTEKLSNRKIIELDETPIGTISVNHPNEASAFLFGFVILPEHQGRGYGRQALSSAIQRAIADKSVLD
jgi:GNAT superfamily N-acetyltransferase